MIEVPKLEARVRPYQDTSEKQVKLAAFAELTIADSFVIKGIRILKKDSEEPFVVFPAEKGKGLTADRWFDLAHPVTQEARTAAVSAVLEAYKKVSAGS